jgi:hypothetical protein
MMPDLICTHTARNCRNSVSAQIWRVVATAAIATSISSFRLGPSLGYGLKFFIGTLALESGTLP